MLNKGKCKDFSRQQRQISASSCPCYCTAWAAGGGLGWVQHPSITPQAGDQPPAGSTRAIWQLKASNKQCLPSLQVYRESHWCRWLGKEKGKQQRSQLNRHMESAGRVTSVSGALDLQGGFCWDEEEWIWGWRLQYDKVFKLCLSPLSVSVGSLAYFLALDFGSDSGSPVVWKSHSSLPAKLSASFLLLISCQYTKWVPRTCQAVPGLLWQALSSTVWTQHQVKACWWVSQDCAQLNKIMALPHALPDFTEVVKDLRTLLKDSCELNFMEYIGFHIGLLCSKSNNAPDLGSNWDNTNNNKRQLVSETPFINHPGWQKGDVPSTAIQRLSDLPKVT